MIPDRLTLLITPGPYGAAWREAIVARAIALGWPIADVGPEGLDDDRPGVLFVNHPTSIALATGHRAVIVDTSAEVALDPSVTAVAAELALRSHSLVEADAAARMGVEVFYASSRQLTLPGLGVVERAKGRPSYGRSTTSESPLSIFDSLPVSAGAASIWSPQWFAYAASAKSVDGLSWIDMTGRMKALVFGPFIRLPAGRWRVDVRFSVDPERGHVPLLFEWGSGVDFSRITTKVRHSGSYSVSLDRIWSEAGDAQLRIWNAHPLFQGKLGFEDCRIVRVADDDLSPLTPVDRIVTAEVL